jgi:hypothetical protein
MTSPIRVLRADHVNLFYTYLRVPVNPPAEKGWLVLTEAGVVKFYEQRRLNVGERPTFVAPSVTEFAQKVGKAYVRAKFGKVSRFVYFTGFKYQAGSAADIEGTVGAAASVLGNSLIGTIGSGASVLSEGLEYSRNLGGLRKRKQEAKNAWFPVLTGKRRWQDINSKEESSPGSRNSD